MIGYSERSKETGCLTGGKTIEWKSNNKYIICKYIIRDAFLNKGIPCVCSMI